jgi:alkylation response protein AidB-like acyl-CoA dehydrogenase
VIEAARAEALATPQPRPQPGPVELASGWPRLAALGRRDLVLARLVEGHVDAVNILAEAGRRPVPDAVYGVWASGSGRTGLRAEPRTGFGTGSGPSGGEGWLVSGQMRFCTGARWIDRALVTARTPEGELLLLDVGVQDAGWRPVPNSWPAVGMDLSESLDVEVDTRVPIRALVGPAGFYLDRAGFSLGGIGVAAVWLGGAAGILDQITDGLRAGADAHQLAHLGAMTAAVRAADAVLTEIGSAAADLGVDELAEEALLARAVVDAAVTTVLERGPRVTGPTPLCRDGDFAHRVSDLAVYVRQQHAERDLAELGRLRLAGPPMPDRNRT